MAAVSRQQVAATPQGQTSEPGVAAGTDGKGGGFEGVLRVSELGSRLPLLQQHVLGPLYREAGSDLQKVLRWDMGQIQPRAVTCASASEARAPMRDLTQHS